MYADTVTVEYCRLNAQNTSLFSYKSVGGGGGGPLHATHPALSGDGEDIFAASLEKQNKQWRTGRGKIMNLSLGIIILVREDSVSPPI